MAATPSSCLEPSAPSSAPPAGERRGVGGDGGDRSRTPPAEPPRPLRPSCHRENVPGSSPRGRRQLRCGRGTARGRGAAGTARAALPPPRCAPRRHHQRPRAAPCRGGWGCLPQGQCWSLPLCPSATSCAFCPTPTPRPPHGHPTPTPHSPHTHPLTSLGSGGSELRPLPSTTSPTAARVTQLRGRHHRTGCPSGFHGPWHRPAPPGHLPAPAPAPHSLPHSCPTAACLCPAAVCLCPAAAHLCPTAVCPCHTPAPQLPPCCPPLPCFCLTLPCSEPQTSPTPAPHLPWFSVLLPHACPTADPQ